MTVEASISSIFAAHDFNHHHKIKVSLVSHTACSCRHALYYVPTDIIQNSKLTKNQYSRYRGRNGGGNQSNLLAAADLAEAALETALISIDGTKDDRGILIGAQAQSLHIPSDLKFTADRLLASPGKVGSANNDINAIRNMGVMPGGYTVNRRFTDTNAYFIKTDVPNGTKMFVRVPLQTKMEPDFDTGNVRFKARERYSFGVSDWRGFFGSAGGS